MISTEKPLFLVRKEAAERLKAAGIDAYVLEADLLAGHVLGKSRTFILTHPEFSLSQHRQSLLENLLQRRIQMEPIQYILGCAPFMDIVLSVGPDVLIPRQDTEILAETLIADIGADEKHFLDLCTGSGCIVLSVLHACARATAAASDLSPAALSIAEQNAERLRLHRRICFYQGSFFEPIPQKRQFDYIVSNPPYIPSKELSGLEKQVKAYEPKLALDGGTDGLSAYRAIISKAPSYLKQGGKILLEVGAGQAQQVSELLYACQFRNISAAKDLNGIYRAVSANIS